MRALEEKIRRKSRTGDALRVGGGIQNAVPLRALAPVRDQDVQAQGYGGSRLDGAPPALPIPLPPREDPAYARRVRQPQSEAAQRVSRRGVERDAASVLCRGRAHERRAQQVRHRRYDSEVENELREETRSIRFAGNSRKQG